MMFLLSQKEKKHVVKNLVKENNPIYFRYSGVFQQLMTFPKRRPYATNILIATIKTGLADYVVTLVFVLFISSGMGLPFSK